MPKKTKLLYYDTTPGGYRIIGYRIDQSVDPTEYRRGYIKFYRTVATVLPTSTDSGWTPIEQKRAQSWRELLQLPSTHIIDVRAQEPKTPRKIITAYLRLSASKSSGDTSAKRIASFLHGFLESNDGSSLLHPILIDVSLLAAIVGLWYDLRLDGGDRN